MTKSDFSKSSTADDSITIDIQPFLSPFAMIISSIIVAVSIIVSGNIISDSVEEIEISTTTTAANNRAAPQAEEPTTAKTSVDDDAIIGNKKKAKVAIIEFSDYQCPYCKKFYSETLSSLKENYINKDEVIFVYRDLPIPQLHPFAQIQAEAAECAGEQNKYYDMHDAIFTEGVSYTEEEANTLSQEELTALIADKLKALASKIGLNTSKFNKCLDNGDMTNEVNADAQEANNIGIYGTPGFVVGKLNDDGTVEGDIISGAYPYDTFDQTIQKYL